MNKFEALVQEGGSDFKELISKSSKISFDNQWDAKYENLPVVFALSIDDLM